MSSPTHHFTAEDGPTLLELGATAYVKKPNPVYMSQVETDFSVDTNEGTMHARAGDFLAYDPISGHVWPVAQSYVGQHYDPKED
jgi:hypothetical protein